MSTPGFVPGSRPTLSFSVGHKGEFILPYLIIINGGYSPSLTYEGDGAADLADPSGGTLQGGTNNTVPYHYTIPGAYIIKLILKSEY